MLKNRPVAFSDHEIRVRAHRIWEKKGKPQGCGEDHWREALAQLQAESGMTEVVADYVPARPEVSTPPARIATVFNSRPESKAA